MKCSLNTAYFVLRCVFLKRLFDPKQKKTERHETAAANTLERELRGIFRIPELQSLFSVLDVRDQRLAEELRLKTASKYMRQRYSAESSVRNRPLSPFARQNDASGGVFESKKQCALCERRICGT